MPTSRRWPDEGRRRDHRQRVAPQALRLDTDQIIPADWSERVERTGFDKELFATWRDDRDLRPQRRAIRAQASIIVAGPAFGVGSSREHAVWAIQQYGFDAIVPSF